MMRESGISFQSKRFPLAMKSLIPKPNLPSRHRDITFALSQCLEQVFLLELFLCLTESELARRQLVDYLFRYFRDITVHIVQFLDRDNPFIAFKHAPYYRAYSLLSHVVSLAHLLPYLRHIDAVFHKPMH